jgi:hypothetical protein
MSKNKDPNYDFSEDVMKSLITTLMHPNLGWETLETGANETITYTLTIVKCMANTSDLWFYSKFEPRTVLYAVLISTVHEYIMDNVKKHQSRAFWMDLADKTTAEQEKIKQIADNVKNDDKINIDYYHEKFREDLNVSTQ